MYNNGKTEHDLFPSQSNFEIEILNDPFRCLHIIFGLGTIVTRLAARFQSRAMVFSSTSIFKISIFGPIKGCYEQFRGLNIFLGLET